MQYPPDGSSRPSAMQCYLRCLPLPRSVMGRCLSSTRLAGVQSHAKCSRRGYASFRIPVPLTAPDFTRSWRMLSCPFAAAMWRAVHASGKVDVSDFRRYFRGALAGEGMSPSHLCCPWALVRQHSRPQPERVQRRLHPHTGHRPKGALSQLPGPYRVVPRKLG